MGYGTELVIGDDGYVYQGGAPGDYDIVGVGDRNRGGDGPVLGAQDALYILGELAQRSPAFNQYIQRRAASNRPVVQRTPLTKARDWQIDFGPVCSGAGTTTTITVTPQVLFRGERMMVQDTASPVGTGTRVQSILVGQKSQRPATTNTLSVFFANNATGAAIRWDTCEKGLSISLTVSFISAVTFDATVWGKAVL